MDKFVEEITKRLTVNGKHFSAVKNPDGFLTRSEVMEKLKSEAGLMIRPAKSSLEMRVDYEMADKEPGCKVCYVIDNPENILPDLRKVIYVARQFNIYDLIPACDENVTRQTDMNFEIAEWIYGKGIVGNLSSEETKFIFREAQAKYGFDASETIEKLHSITLNWDDAKTMKTVCELIVEAIRIGKYNAIETAIDEINADFQRYIDNRYFMLSSSSYLDKPKMVNRILPHIANKHERYENVALVVIDGMNFWQYIILEKDLQDIGLKPDADITTAWLPSITKLSRQAIFKGDAPDIDYKQSPQSEAGLWYDFWISKERGAKRLDRLDVGYTHGSLNESYNLSRKHAFVDIELDKKMHSSSDNKDLYDLTRNWSKKAAADIKILHDKGYHIYITTDHGNVMAHKWRQLSSHEKTFLYHDESRGSRHLIYTKREYLDDFIQKNEDIKDDVMVHDNWLAWRKALCFKNNDEITHGGSHFLEVMIPFVTIE